MCQVFQPSNFIMPPTKLWVGIKICTSYVRPYIQPEICVRNSSYTTWWILFISTHSDQHDMEMSVKTGFCDTAIFKSSGTLSFFYYIAYRGKILCAQLLLHPLMDFVHTHTQWPTLPDVDLRDGILRCCKFYMRNETLSEGGGLVEGIRVHRYIRLDCSCLLLKTTARHFYNKHKIIVFIKVNETWTKRWTKIDDPV